VKKTFSYFIGSKQASGVPSETELLFSIDFLKTVQVENKMKTSLSLWSILQSCSF